MHRKFIIFDRDALKNIHKRVFFSIIVLANISLAKYILAHVVLAELVVAVFGFSNLCFSKSWFNFYGLSFFTRC